MPPKTAIKTNSFYGEKTGKRPLKRLKSKYRLDQKSSTEVKLAQGQWIIRSKPVECDQICRVEACNLYGTRIKNFERHLAQHKLSFNDHQLLPVATLHKRYKHAGNWMKYRRVERCFMPGCESNKDMINQLTRHLMREHSLSRKEYRELLQKEDFFRGHGLCPAMQEKIDCAEVDELPLPMDLPKISEYRRCRIEQGGDGNVDSKTTQGGDVNVDLKKTYPCYQDVHFYTEPVTHHSIELRRSPRITLQTLPPDPYSALVLRKLLLSAEHALAFAKSLKTKVIGVNKPDVSMLWYQCSLCTQIHTVKIIMYQA